MRGLLLCLAAALCVARPAGAQSPAPDAFRTTAAFSVDAASLSLTSAVATIEPRRGGGGYSWLRIHFYAFPPDADDIAGAVKGTVQSMERKWMATAVRPEVYNTSHAVIQLTVDRTSQITQVDMSIPGRACTIAWRQPELAKFAGTYRFDRQTLRLKAKGTFVCDMASLRMPNQNFAWDIDVDLPVFAKVD